MASFADMQARARARASRDTPEITMDNTERQQGDPGEDTFDNSDNENTGATLQRNHGNNDLTRIIQLYNLPEGTLADVERFQQVCFQASCFDTNMRPQFNT